MYQAHNEVQWEGVAYEIATEKIYRKLDKLARMIKILSLMSNFMGTAHDNYRDGLEEIKKNFDEILDKIREEKAKRGEVWNNI